MHQATSSWADEIEDGELTSLPQPSEKMVGDNKIITEYTTNEEGRKLKIIRTFKVEKKLVSKAVARRKVLVKFGKSYGCRAGPDPATTVVSEEILMNFIAGKDENEKDQGEESALERLKNSNKGIVKCRICKEDHWTTKCPYKDSLAPPQKSQAGGEKEDADKAPAANAAPAVQPGGTSTAKYIPPSRREGARAGESMPDRKRMDDTYAIRVSNLSENTQESDLQELFKPFGNIGRIYLARDKVTNQCKGFAFVNYHKKEDAAMAIGTLHGHGYDYLILSVEWAKPPSNQ